MPIEGVDPHKITTRAELYEHAANKLLAYPSFAPLKITLDPLAFNVAAEAYFFLNVAYKSARIPPNSKTLPSKVAAMTALAIGNTQPIRPPSLNVNEEEYLFINGALALKVACGLQRHPFDTRPFDDRLRWYRMVQELRLPSLAPIFCEANSAENALKSVFRPSLKQEELAIIDSVVEAFCLMAEVY